MGLVITVWTIIIGIIYIIYMFLKESFEGTGTKNSGMTIEESLAKQGIRMHGTPQEEEAVRKNMPPIANIKQYRAEFDRRCRAAGFLSTDETCRYYELMFPKKKK